MNKGKHFINLYIFTMLLEYAKSIIKNAEKTIQIYEK